MYDRTQLAPVITILCGLLLSTAAANVFNMTQDLTSLETVTVGNAVNPIDANGYGAVVYDYQIGTYEITAAQYTEFLNAVAVHDTYGLYNTEMVTSTHGCQIQRSGSAGSFTYSVDSEAANRPVNKISWADAARFVNWLENGQPTGVQDLSTTEDGTYYLNGAINDTELSGIARQTGCTYAFPTVDEWYKAAYHKNDGATANYWLYPTNSDADPTAAVVDPDPGNHANFNQMLGAAPWRTLVGEFENSASSYGTYDQGGNIAEMTEGLSGSHMIALGGAYWYNDAVMRKSHEMTSFTRTSEESVLGFRIVKLPAPAPVDVFDMGTDLTSLAMVPVGNVGNSNGSDGHGAVAYDYRIGSYEVTVAQYTQFLNAVAADDTYGLYNTDMTATNGCQIQRSGTPGFYTYSVSADAANRPVNKVSWGDAARFVNWLHNGQPSGTQDVTTTEDGAYFLDGATSSGDLLAVSRESDYLYALPNLDEWFKAAYHKNNGPTDNYWLYPTASDTDPTAAIVDPDPGNNANFNQMLGGPPWRTVVGEFENSVSAYGTFDQGGNVWEMTEGVSGSQIVARGGSYWVNDYYMRKTNPYTAYTRTSEENDLGFRIVAYTGPPVCGDWGYDAADINQDCYVTWDDVAVLTSQWVQENCTQPAWCLGSDVNRDGTVALDDFAEVAYQWRTCTDPNGVGCSDQKLIQIGWDMQNPDELAANVVDMQYMPFDGITIRTNYSYTCIATSLTEQDILDDIATLQAIDWDQFEHNFFYFVLGRNVDWFDDYAWAEDGQIMKNIRYVARVAKAAGCKGLLFDPEFVYWGYEAGPFDYEDQPRTGEKSFSEMAAMARMRGSRFMTHMQQEFPDVVLLNLFWLSHGFSAIWGEYDPAAREAILDGHQYGLLPAFMDGMLQAAGPQTIIIDGNEPSYYYTQSDEYFNARFDILERNRILISPELRAKYRTHSRCGHAIYADYIWNHNPGMTEQQRAQWMEHNIYWALKTSDRYVWFYNEQMNWVTGENIPSLLVPAIESARSKISAGENLGF